MAATPDGKGYWLVASDGGIFSYGDARFYGSTGRDAPQPTRGGDGGHTRRQGATGWWPPTAASSAYGDAQFYGSTGSIRLNKPIVGMLAGPGGDGYFLVASDGGVFSYGSAPFYGSLGGQALKRPIVAAVSTPTGNGYWFTDSAGLVSNFGSADYYGSAPPNLFRPIVGMADAPGNGSFVGGPVPLGRLRLRHQHLPVHAACLPAPIRSASSRWTAARRRTPTPAWPKRWPGRAAGSTSTRS